MCIRDRIQKEAEKAAEKFRKEMKTEEAYRVKSMADQIAEETMEYGLSLIHISSTIS